jgi:hypothetical protein
MGNNSISSKMGDGGKDKLFRAQNGKSNDFKTTTNKFLNGVDTFFEKAGDVFHKVATNPLTTGLLNVTGGAFEVKNLGDIVQTGANVGRQVKDTFKQSLGLKVSGNNQQSQKQQPKIYRSPPANLPSFLQMEDLQLEQVQASLLNYLMIFQWNHQLLSLKLIQNQDLSLSPNLDLVH